ncbi:MAG: hypothetical protein MUE58_07475 [Chitinophagaceae bacterium]|nr:hypothetical protein [Chitinophagaceae bacterium]
MRKSLFLTAFALQVLGGLQAQVNSATFGMLEARQMGPGTMSGRITDIVGVNKEAGKILYVGTAGGGIWKSINAGVTFKPVFDKYCQSIGALAIDQTNPKVIYAGTGESNMRNSVSIGDGLYKSTDAGDNWTKIGLDSTEHIAKIVIDPSNSNIVYVAAPGPLWSDSKHRGLYKSSDAGKTWEKILYVNEKAGCADVSVDPKNPNIVYATTWEFRRLPYLFNSGGAGSGIYKSLDGGKTWKELSNGLPAKPFGRTALALAPSAPNNLLAIVESAKTGLYISADGGESWKQQSATLNVVSRPFYFSTLVIDPQDPKRVYRPAYSFSYSSDGGYSFTEATDEGGWVHSDHHALWINPSNTNHMFLGTDGGVYMSMDKGNNWIFMQNIPVGQFYHVDIDNRNPYRLYGGLQDNGSWMAPSSTPGGVGNGDWKAIYGGDGFWVVPDGVDEHIVYAESQGGDINRIDTRTLKSVSIRPQPGTSDGKLRWNWNTPIATGKANPKNLYTGAQYLYKSVNQGRTWARISPDLTTNDKKKQEQENSGGLSADNTSAENHTTIFTIAESPLDENLVWVGTDDGNLQFTTDGGKTWTNVSRNIALTGIPAQTWVSSIDPSRFDRNVVFATFDNHMYGDHKTYAAMSTDMGKTWKKFSSDEFTGFAHKIKQDLKNRDLLFLGTEMGLFATVDGGASWFRMKNNIPWYALVRDIQIHPATNDLVLGTHGRGIMIVDDISPMRAMTKDVVDQDVYIFDPKPVTLTMGTFGSGGFPSTGGWVAPNAPSIPPIQYYLKDRVSSGKVQLDIYDAAGKLVQSIPGTTRKGINNVSWNLRTKPPKTASGATKRDVGAFIAPQVLPGDYTMKLSVAGKEYSKPLKLVHDPKSDFTLADRELQYNTSMELYRMHEDLAKTVTEIADKQKVLKANLPNIKNAKLKKQVQDYHDQLETLRAELIPTKQTSIFADETRLREDITEVYLSVAMTEAAPNNLQIDRVKDLRNKVDQAELKRKQIEGQFENKIKGAMSSVEKSEGKK